MPELAEVETVKRVLSKDILRKKIVDIEIIYPKIIENDINYFKENLINKEFIDIKRRGKYLLFETNTHFLVSHLRMEGKYFIKDNSEKIEKHEHIIFRFKDFSLRYHDTRKFGRMHLIKKDEIESYFKNVGPDANSNIDINYLMEKINKNIPIKSLLLDQSIISGLGNIYVDEVLYLSSIDPRKLGKDISIFEGEKIILNSKKILDKAIECKGCTIRTYTSSLGVKGLYQNYLCVHTKNKCPNNHDVSIIKIGGRSTYFCKECQK